MNFLHTLHRTALTLFLFIVCTPVAQAQRNVIKFDPDNCDKFTHGFRNIIVLDQRPDTLGTIGYVKLGLGNRPVKVETGGPLGQKIAAYYRALSGKAVSNSGKDLVVVIYDLMATEDGMGFTKEFALFRYRAEYFVGEDRYTPLGMIDTTVEISAGDVTAKLMRKVDECLCGFCQHLMDKRPPVVSDTAYTLAGIRELEASRRLNMPAYMATAYPDGIYATWADFLQLNYLKDKKLIEHKKKHFVAQGINKKGKPYTFGVVAMNPEQTIKPGRIIVFQGIPYKAFEGKFYPMSFSDDHNFHFTARTSRYNPGVGNFMPMAGVGGGAMGVGVFIVVSGGSKPEEYDFTINWRTGKVVPVRQLNAKAKRKS